jgi:hypothetical protein
MRMSVRAYRDGYLQALEIPAILGLIASPS